MFNSNADDPIRVPKAAALMADRVRRAIVRGELKDGDSLPSESGLMAEFGVSRPTAREAIRILESEGLIRVGRGARGGAKVTRPDSSIVARAAGLALQTEGVTIKDVYEARMLIEPPAARRAAQHRPKTAAKVLRSHVEFELSVIDDRLAVTQAIADFHKLLMEQSGNQTLSILATALKGVFERALLFSQSSRKPVLEDDRVAQLRFGLRSHTRLVDLIEIGDGIGAEAHWQSHMENAGKIWLTPLHSKTAIDILG